MKSMFLSVVIICALAISALGGTFATWSDSETSWDNYIETGSVDLKVNGHDDNPWDTDGVPAKVEITCMIPCKWYGPFEVELWNAGQCEFPSKAYIHLKNMVCSNILPKVDDDGNTTGYPDPTSGMPYSGDLKPEPELVAEYGGWVNSVYVTGIGAEGDDCSMGTHVDMCITDSTTDPSTVGFRNVITNPDGVVLRDKIGKWDCVEFYLFDLYPCNERTIYLWFHLQQRDDDDIGNFIKTPEELGIDPATHPDEYAAALLHWKKFNDWPSWALMKDRVDFDLEFDLWLVDP